MENLGFRDLKNGKEGVPNFIKSLIFQAKGEEDILKLHWSKTPSGRVALAWLLGLYDGDGTYMGRKQAKIYSSNKNLLLEIKLLFGVENEVDKQAPQDNYNEEDSIVSKKLIYYLTLGSKIFDFIMSSYKWSMLRKRSDQKYDI